MKESYPFWRANAAALFRHCDEILSNPRLALVPLPFTVYAMLYFPGRSDLQDPECPNSAPITLGALFRCWRDAADLFSVTVSGSAGDWRILSINGSPFSGANGWTATDLGTGEAVTGDNVPPYFLIIRRLGLEVIAQWRLHQECLKKDPSFVPATLEEAARVLLPDDAVVFSDTAPRAVVLEPDPEKEKRIAERYACLRKKKRDDAPVKTSGDLRREAALREEAGQKAYAFWKKNAAALWRHADEIRSDPRFFLAELPFEIKYCISGMAVRLVEPPVTLGALFECWESAPELFRVAGPAPAHDTFIISLNGSPLSGHHHWTAVDTVTGEAVEGEDAKGFTKRCECLNAAVLRSHAKLHELKTDDASFTPAALEELAVLLQD